MKVNVAAISQVLSSGAYAMNDIIHLVRPVAGKKAQVDVAESATGAQLIAAASAAFAFPSSLSFKRVVLVLNDVELDGSKKLAELGIKADSTVQVRYQVQHA